MNNKKMKGHLTRRTMIAVAIAFLLMTAVAPHSPLAAVAGADGSTTYAAAKYKVTFISQGGSGVKAKSVAPGGKVGRLKPSKNKNLAFKGWYTKPVGGKKVTKNTKVRKGMICYAHWQAKKGKVRATFKANGYNIYKGYAKKAKLGVAAVKKVTRAGYIFQGWFTKKSGGKKISRNTTIAKHTTYYAHWKKKGTKVLVAYFSCTGTTKRLAEYAADILGSDIYKIVPKKPYTSDDLDYNDDSSRANREQNNPSARPSIKNGVKNMDKYDVILLGYPIWHGQAPKIIYTFLEKYNFSGKTLVPFCTSHSSGIGSSDTKLHALASNANWMEGKRFAAGTSKAEISKWIGSLGLKTGS